MPDLNLDVNFREHIKTKRLVAMLGKEFEFAPVKLWLHAAKIHPESGKLKGYAASEIESFVDWTGTPGAFIGAMEKLDWLKKDAAGNYVLCGWKEHQGHLVAFKVRGKKAAKARWDRALGRMQQAYNKHPTSNSKTLPSNAPTDGTNGANGTEIKECEGREDVPVEFPKGFPLDEAQAIEWARVGGSRATDEQIRLYWNEAATRNGKDVTGQPISRWSQHCNARTIRNEGRQAEAATMKQARPVSSMDIRNVIEAKKSMANDIRNRWASETATGTTWSDHEKRREYFQLHKEIKELTKKMGTMM